MSARPLKLAINPRLVDKNVTGEKELFVYGWENVEQTIEELATTVKKGIAYSAQLQGKRKAANLSGWAGFAREKVTRFVSDTAAAITDFWPISASIPPLVKVLRSRSIRIRGGRSWRNCFTQSRENMAGLLRHTPRVTHQPRFISPGPIATVLIGCSELNKLATRFCCGLAIKTPSA